ncbi:hypothetical protein EPA93_32690 [Ktedonosporobacter rubrisoli]|uniref:Uncharacterized protein n=1 Tax=Ktedonosporobacter rubrisoli TaxID=2509675 RepID=A0A4P6JXJ2_KTERU|nr:hypothetical protein [Ktedonosporobacter rubrisoli]QBD80477.1 hypothetical protein EPA93_32690 [Ktedonosporobacter rubrisoli]
MHLLHSHNPWHYQQGSDPTIDFCLWVLQVDGLRVPPFDLHPDGDSSLRALGLTANAWQSWFLRVLNPTQREQDEQQLQQMQLTEYLKITGEPDLEHLKRRHQAEQLKIATTPPLPPPPEFYHYQASWMGSHAIKNRLIELEKQFRQSASQRERQIKEVTRVLSREERKATQRLYDELKPYHRQIPALSIYFVIYASPLDYLIPPATLLITVQEGQPGFQEFRERVLTAAAELATGKNQHRRSSAYRRIETSTGQVTAYCRHTRQTVPPPLKKPEIPQLNDPLRQMIVEELANEPPLDVLVDLASIRFLREKQRPGWKLYEVTFRETETEGERYRMIVIFQQNADGSWRSHGGGTTLDTQDQWAKSFAPVHDHPLIFLGTQGLYVGDQQYLHIAHGNLIDNGFHVERVRLINEAGQALEDTVEEGYVFFACKPEERVQLPMQAELYDRQGQLVWQQKIPEQGLPPWIKVRYKH